MDMTLDEIEERIYKISAEYRCPNTGTSKQDCGHPGCVTVFAFWKSMKEYFKNVRNCPVCEGTGQRKVKV